MPWAPELFSAPALQQVLDKHRRERLRSVPFFDGLASGEIDALLGSFSGVPEVHHPIRGRIKGEAAFRRFVADTSAWMAERHVEVEPVHIVPAQPHGVEEVVLHLDDEDGRIALPLAVAADRGEDDRIVEFRLYFSTRPLTGLRAARPALLSPDPALQAPDVIGEYQRALATGDVDAVLAAFAPDGSVREPVGAAVVHRGAEELRAHYARSFSGGGIVLEPCAVADDGRVCALEYNMLTWDRSAPSPQPGLGVFVRGDRGRLAAVRVYDDAGPPTG